LAGANIIYGLGMLDMGVCFCYKQLLMDADVADMVKFTVAGLPVNDASLSVDIIKEVGAAKNFLSHKDTFQNRKIQSNPVLFDRNMRGRWEERGSQSMSERAEAKLRTIVAQYRPPELPPAVRKTIRDIVNEAEDKYGLPLSVD
jgi:trimethylamine--corrinoid protein Co-methyltransferase